MNHLREYDSDEEKMLGDLQNLGLSPKPHHYYITYISSYDDREFGGEAISLSASNLVDVASMLLENFGMFDEVEEPDFEKHVAKYKNITGILDHVEEGFYQNGSGFTYSVWELTPKNNVISEGGDFEAAPLSNPAQCYQIGNSRFSDFDRVLNDKPYGNI